MSKVRQVIKLYSQNFGKKKISLRLGMSKNTVKIYIDRYIQLKTTADDVLKLSDLELDKLFHPPKTVPVNERIQQLYDYFPEMEKQLRKRGVTVAMLFKKFKEAHPEAYAETSFYGYYRQWKKKVNPSMHIEHKAADKMYIDFAGATLPFVDKDTGEIKDGQVFVSILGWSQYAYVEVIPNQTVEEFIAACENALHFFEGVPMAIVPDNLKSAVLKASRYEPIVNENFKSFADHYGTAVLPTRARKPKDKAHVENMVKIAYQSIYAKIPDRQLLSLSELNIEVQKHLAVLNNGLLTGKECSRADQWSMEKSQLQPLADTRYEIRKIKQVTVMKNGHVLLTEDHHYYSVPYELIGQKLTMQYSRSTVGIYLKYQLIAEHKRIKSSGNYTTEPSHLASHHQYVMEWSPTFFMERAKAIDPSVEYFISQVLSKKQHPEQAFKSCQGILSFASRVGHTRLINACKRAHEIGYYNYKIIEDILKNNLDRYEEDPVVEQMPVHENIRGGNYYQ